MRWISLSIVLLAILVGVTGLELPINTFNFLRPGSPDSMLTREKVKNILHSMKPTFVEGRQPKGLSRTELENLHKKYYLGPKSNRTEAHHRSIPDANKAVSDYMLEGDMLLSEEHARKLTGSRNKRMVTTDQTLYWSPSIPINYTIENSISKSTRTVILSAIKFWSDNSCLKFKDNVAGKNVIHFFSGTGCWSYVGKQGGAQDISIGVGCDELGIVTHEMSHAMGFYHTQSSYDRDDYVWINYTNIQNGTQYNFQKYSQSMLTSFPKSMQYDFGSVMQYDSYAFAANTNFPTILALNPLYTNTMGQRFEPSFADVRMMNLLYNCTDHCNPRPPCQNLGYADPHNCSQCKCIYVLSGKYCTEIQPGSAQGCDGRILQASSDWQTLKSSVGNPKNWAGSENASWCYYAIKGPECSFLEFALTDLKALCMQECWWQGIEINAGHLDLGGMMMCCPSFINTTMATMTNMITIKAFIRWNQMNFTLQYRIKPNAQQDNCTITGSTTAPEVVTVTDAATTSQLSTSTADSTAVTKPDCPCKDKKTTTAWHDGEDGPLKVVLIMTNSDKNQQSMLDEVNSRDDGESNGQEPSHMAMG